MERNIITSNNNDSQDFDLIVSTKPFIYYETLDQIKYDKRSIYVPSTFNSLAVTLYFTLYFLSENFRNYILQYNNPSLTNIILKGHNLSLPYVEYKNETNFNIPYTHGISIYFNTNTRNVYRTVTYIFGGYYINKLNHKVISNELYYVDANDADPNDSMLTKIASKFKPIIPTNKDALSNSLARYNCGLVVFLSQIIIIGGFGLNDKGLKDAYVVDSTTADLWFPFPYPEDVDNTDLLNKVTIDYSRHSIILFDSTNNDIWEYIMGNNAHHVNVHNFNNWIKVGTIPTQVPIFYPCLSYMGTIAYGNVVITGIQSCNVHDNSLQEEKKQNFKQISWIYYRAFNIDQHALRMYDDYQTYFYHAPNENLNDLYNNNDVQRTSVNHWKVINLCKTYLFCVIASYYDKFSRSLLLINNSIYDENDIRYTTIRTINSTIYFLKNMILIKSIKSLNPEYISDYKIKYEAKLNELIENYTEEMNRPSIFSNTEHNEYLKNMILRYEQALLSLTNNYDNEYFNSPSTQEYIKALDLELEKVTEINREKKKKNLTALRKIKDRVEKEVENALSIATFTEDNFEREFKKLYKILYRTAVMNYKQENGEEDESE